MPELEGDEPPPDHDAAQADPDAETEPEHVQQEQNPDEDLAQTLDDQFRALTKKQNRINENVLRGVYHTDTVEGRETLRLVYEQWMTDYEKYLNTSEQF